MRIVRVQERHPVLIHALLDIWERSVKATHLFLSDGEIENIKEYVPRALMGVENLTVAENEDGQSVAFMGTESGTLEMLFIAPEERGKGLGKRLFRYGIDHLGGKRTGGQRAEPAGKGLLRAHGFSRLQTNGARRTGRPLSALVHEPAEGKRRFFGVTREENCRISDGTLKDI